MFATPLRQPASRKLTPAGQTNLYEITDKGYGKDAVKVMHIDRKGPFHTIQELEVGTHLKLNSEKDYLQGDNLDIVATDSQKNTVYLLAKQYGIKSPEKFGLLLARHFLNKYNHVDEAHVHIEASPWQRISFAANGDKSQQLHNHAFFHSPSSFHYCDIIIKRNDPIPTIISGIKGLRVLKTTQSSFVNFVDDEFRTLDDQYDRIFSTIVDCSWEYSGADNINFVETWETVHDIVLKNFAGDPIVGVPSPSVQHTVYLTEKQVLDTIPHVAVVSMSLPNKHYFNFNTQPFQQLVPGSNNEVFIPTDKPHGTIYAKLSRKDLKSHL